jgi:hypothetical protein
LDMKKLPMEGAQTTTAVVPPRNAEFTL